MPRPSPRTPIHADASTAPYPPPRAPSRTAGRHVRRSSMTYRTAIPPDSRSPGCSRPDALAHREQPGDLESGGMAVRYVILLRRTCRPAVRLGARGGGDGAVLASAWMGVRGEGRGIPHPARRAREEDGADP